MASIATNFLHSVSCPPTTSNVNFATGTSDANMVIADLSSSGRLNIYNGGAKGTVNAILDISGWFTATIS